MPELIRERELTSTELPFAVQNWGLINYASALKRQGDLVERIKAGSHPDTLVFCSHPPIVTVGRSTQPGDIESWEGETMEVSRGGRATYHGPNQQVIYPLVSLQRESREFLHQRDVHGYLRCLESAVIRTLQTYHLPAEVKVAAADDDEMANRTGVWVGERKIASIGVAVRGWVTYHGVALNVDHDPTAFRGIKPCGYSRATMVSMEELLGAPVARNELISRLTEGFRFYFS